MSRQTFHLLLERYLSGNCTPEEEEMVRQWYDLLDHEQTVDLDDVSFEELETRLWVKVKAVTLAQTKKKTKRPLNWTAKRLWTRVKIPQVAVIIFFLTLALGTGGIWMLLPKDSIDPEFVRNPSSISVIKNIHEKPMMVILPDSSTVELFQGAEIRYSASFVQREVALTGNALFRVQANPLYPFVVFHKGMVTKVLGTCFLIKSGIKKGNDEVIVYSGKVEVIRSLKDRNLIARIMEEPKAVFLTMNQRVVLDAKKDTLIETIAETPVPIEANRNLLKEVAFREVSLRDIAKRLGDVYGINVVVQPSVRDVTFTGDLSDMELFKQLNLICNVTETTYRLSGKSIIIQ